MIKCEHLEKGTNSNHWNITIFITLAYGMPSKGPGISRPIDLNLSAVKIMHLALSKFYEKKCFEDRV